MTSVQKTIITTIIGTLTAYAVERWWHRRKQKALDLPVVPDESSPNKEEDSTPTVQKL